jgi:hypothetical protein
MVGREYGKGHRSSLLSALTTIEKTRDFLDHAFPRPRGLESSRHILIVDTEYSENISDIISLGTMPPHSPYHGSLVPLNLGENIGRRLAIFSRSMKASIVVRLP